MITRALLIYACMRGVLRALDQALWPDDDILAVIRQWYPPPYVVRVISADEFRERLYESTREYERTLGERQADAADA